MSGIKKISNFKLFEEFTSSLAQVQKQDGEILSQARPKPAFCFRLALYLQTRFPGLFVDLEPTPENKVIPLCDILVHSRGKDDYRPMAIICRPGYLSSADKKHLASLASRDKSLALGVAFSEKKDYFLIYNVLKERIEYYHFDRETLFCRPLKNRQNKNLKIRDTQLKLHLGSSVPKKKKS